MVKNQFTLFDTEPLSGDINALDGLFQASNRYCNSQAYYELLQFIAKFSRYSPYNCFLLHMQNPNVTHVATPNQWHKRFKRRVKPDAKPMIILAPMGPVLFVYDLVDTDGPKLPAHWDKPFRTKGELSPSVWKNTVSNCKRDHILLAEKESSFLHAGAAIRLRPNSMIKVDRKIFPAKCEIQINKYLSITSKYSILVHELAHIHCGHLGNDKDEWWPERLHLTKQQRELEAESVVYLVCQRQGIQTRSAEYLAGYTKDKNALPLISLHLVLKIATYIESMGKCLLPKRKMK